MYGIFNISSHPNNILSLTTKKKICRIEKIFLPYARSNATYYKILSIYLSSSYAASDVTLVNYLTPCLLQVENTSRFYVPGNPTPTGTMPQVARVSPA